MRNSNRMLAAVGGAALALALTACGEDPVDEVDETAMEADADTLVVAEFDPLSRDYTLTPEQQEARDAFDMEAMQTEYAGYRDEIAAGESGDAETSADSGAMADSGADAASTGTLPERSEMDWAYLDRDGDDQLSVAEYAIWAVPVDPNEPKPNDQTQPYLTSDQANSAADSFFYYDRDGDTYLSQEEFSAARSGAVLD